METYRTIKSLIVLVFLSSAATAAIIDTVPVGNPGNIGELSGDRICGAVAYEYNVCKYEVTSAQYTEFLNAVAADDPYTLYNAQMVSHNEGCKIVRSGSSGSYSYSVAADQASRPVNFVSFWDACRFANWLHNGQPTGPEGAGTTETGAYTLDGYYGSDGRTIQRNAGCTWVVASEDEWYKAAYHKNDGASGNYFTYPTGHDQGPSNVLVDPDPGNNANFLILDPYVTYTLGPPYYRTEVGAFENSASPYGTFDQGGNVWEWMDTVMGDTASRIIRGGSYTNPVGSMDAAGRYGQTPTSETSRFGFRVCLVPEPGGLLVLMLAGLSLIRRR